MFIRIDGTISNAERAANLWRTFDARLTVLDNASSEYAEIMKLRARASFVFTHTQPSEYPFADQQFQNAITERGFVSRIDRMIADLQS